MNVTTTTPITRTSSSDFASNPDAQLNSDDFLKLFMTQLQYQDPTAPMETSDMLNQTSQLTQLQTNQDLKDSLTKLTNQMGASADYSAVSMIGKMADTGANGFSITDAKNLKSDIPFDLYFKDDYTNATVKIKDRNGDVLKSFDMENGDKGIANFTWDGKDNNGNPVADGEYFVTADYTDTQNKNQTSILGIYPVDSVRFEDGKAQLKVDNKYVALASIKEFLE